MDSDLPVDADMRGMLTLRLLTALLVAAPFVVTQWVVGGNGWFRTLLLVLTGVAMGKVDSLVQDMFG